MSGLASKIGLARGLLGGGAAYAGPFYAGVELTQRCNLKCVGCRFHSPLAGPASSSKPEDLDVPMFRAACRELRAMGTRTLLLTGEGEPLLHPRFADVLAATREAGFRTELYSNGTLLNGENAAAMIEHRLGLLRISLWASSADEYRLHYPGAGPDYFERVLDGIRLLSARKREASSQSPALALYIAVGRHNFSSLGEFARLAVELRCRAVVFHQLRPDTREMAGYAVGPDQLAGVREGLVRAGDFLSRHGVRHTAHAALRALTHGPEVWRLSSCYLAWVAARIKTDGTVVPCNVIGRFRAGNLKNASFREIWNGEVFRNFRRQVMTREGMAAVARKWGCDYCCHLPENLRVDRWFRWLRPLARCTWSRPGALRD